MAAPVVTRRGQGLMLAVFLLAAASVSLAVSLDDPHVPCKFTDSVNITDGVMDELGNIFHDGTLYPQDQYGAFKYEIVDRTKRRTVPNHIRGCICAVRGACLRLCCKPNQYHSERCLDYDDKESASFELPIRNTKTQVDYMVNLTQHFGIIINRPCKEMYDLNTSFEEDQFVILDVS